MTWSEALTVPKRPEPVTFADWIVAAKFGRGIAEHFMFPYTRKSGPCTCASCRLPA